MTRAIRICPDEELEELVQLKIKTQHERNEQSALVIRLNAEERANAKTGKGRVELDAQRSQQALVAARALLVHRKSENEPRGASPKSSNSSPESGSTNAQASAATTSDGVSTPCNAGARIWFNSEQHWTDTGHDELPVLRDNLSDADVNSTVSGSPVEPRLYV